MKKEKNGGTGRFSPVRVLSAVLLSAVLAFGISLAIFIIYAFLLTYTQTSEGSVGNVCIVVSALSVFVGGIVCSTLIKSRGIFAGAVTGLLYAFILIGLSLSLSPSPALTLRTLMLCVVSVCGGGLGGIVGVNIVIK